MGGAGMNPNDVSDRAWQFAMDCECDVDGCMGQLSPEHIARLFDKATADLREDYERCQSGAMFVEWDRDSYDETSATLDAYTPGEPE